MPVPKLGDSYNGAHKVSWTPLREPCDIGVAIGQSYPRAVMKN